MEESLTCINEDKETNSVAHDGGAASIRRVEKERLVQQRLISDCNLHSVTVFLDKAEVCRVIPIDIDADQTLELQLCQLSPCIDKDSIRIEAKGAPITIQDVTFRTKPQDVDCMMADMQRQTVLQSQKNDTRQKELLQAKHSRFSKQRTVLENFADRLIKSQDSEKLNNITEINNEVGNQTPKPAVDVFDPKHMETLNAFFEMYEKQAEKLDEQIFSTKEDLNKTEALLQSYEKKLKELDDVKDRMQSRELSVFIEGKQQIKTDLFIYYVVDQCSWVPSYDIRIINNESKMKITYHAIVQQNTKEDWSDVNEINISTVQPPLGGSVPEMGVQKVGFKAITESKILQSPQLVAKSRKTRTRSMIATHSPPVTDSPLKTSFYNTLSQAEDTSQKDQVGSNLYGSLRSQKSQNKTDIPSATYSVSRTPELIGSGAEASKIIIGYIDLSPSFEYSSVPKRAPYAYLKANATNTSEYVILPGEANVFIDSSFIGKTELKTVAPGEDFNCHLGADHRIQISYHPMYKYREGSMPISKTICIAFKQAIEIINHHSRQIKITVMDQLPVANEDKIKVVLQEPVIKHPEKYDKSKSIRLTKNSQVEWDLDIGSGEKKEIILKYTVDYPAGECLDLISE